MMNRNRQPGYKVKKRQRKYGYRVIVLLLGALLIVGTGVVAYQYHHTPKRYPALQALAVRIDNWWTDRKARIQSQMEKSKAKTSSATATKAKKKIETAESFHFEFYTMLPNDKQQVIADTKPVFNHDTVEQEFAKEMTKAAFVIQTGIFSNAALAEKTRQALADNGLSSKVVKTYMDDHLVYRLQMGPFEEQEKIHEAQEKLAAIGVHGSVHKASANVGEEMA